MTSTFRARALALFLTVLAAVGAQAAAITTLYSTGLDASGALAAGGAVDAHYSIVTGNGSTAVVRTALAGTYAANDSLSQWIWQNADGTPVNTTLVFRTTFDLTGFDPATAVINGLWAADNTGVDILLNGNSLGIALPGTSTSNFSSLHAFSINPGLFVNGLNRLEFVIQDAGTMSAFRAQLSGEARQVQTVPTPDSLPLALAGLALLGAARLRRR